MGSFPATSDQISGLEANIHRQTGMHTLHQQSATVGGIDLGSIDFDPVRHGVHQIDSMSFMESVVGVPQVRIQLPRNPLSVTLVGDYRFEGDMPAVANMKTQALDRVMKELIDSVPSLDKDHVAKITHGNGTPEAHRAVEREVLELCHDGLAIIIGDFRRFRLDQPFSGYADTVAIKLNHPAERRVLPNVGYLPLGHGIEVNTDKPKRLQVVNDELTAMHADTMGRLQQAGARVGEVILHPQSADYVNLPLADQTIAAIISSIS